MRRIILLFILFNLFSAINTQGYLPAEKKIVEYVKEDHPDRSRQGGDTCADPTVISSLPYSDTGTTSGYTDDYDEVCPYTGSTSPDVVYQYTPASDELVYISLCNDGTDYDTKLYVYEGSCSGTLVNCNDDACSTTSYPSPYVSELTDIPLTAGSTYYIIVDGYGGSYGNYEISIEGFTATDHTLADGYNFWSTIGNCETWINFGPEGDFPTLPAGFFGPGSDPFEGQVFFEGDANPDGLVGFDTVTHLIGPAGFINPLPDQTTVPTEFIELQLRSSVPCDVNIDGEVTFWDVTMTLCGACTPPASSLELELFDITGGTYQCDWYFEPSFTFTLLDDAEPMFVETGDTGITFNFQTSDLIPEWDFSSYLNSFDPVGFLELTAPGGSRWLLESMHLRQDEAWIPVDFAGEPILEGSGGTGFESTWFEYPEEDPNWWNMWFYNDPYDPNRKKLISGIFVVDRLDPSIEGYVEIVLNWSTPAWSALQDSTPPLPEDVESVPENTYIIRSEPILEGVVPEGGIVQQILSSDPFEILDYNPEWISIDVRGNGFYLSYSYLEHICYGREWGQYFEFGDAPEDAICYPDLGVTGHFPTCIGGSAGVISHSNYGAWFGETYDFELDGNAGFCPTFDPDNYNADECARDNDAGLMFPEPATIVNDTSRVLQYAACDEPVTPLGDICELATWGANIDINIHNTSPNQEPYQEVFMNVLIDWNMDGIWSLDPTTICDGDTVPEHVLQDFIVPAMYIGPASALSLPDFIIGPTPGYVWARFSITEVPVGDNWDGSGEFEEGETEDYLLYIGTGQEYDLGDAPEPPYPTTFFSNGARHIIDSNIHLGAFVDSEPDGLPSPHCDGDDANGFDDEDGVTHGYLIPGHSTGFDIVASVTGFLNAWIDFNDDGDWNDTGEQIFDNTSLFPGTNSLSVYIPQAAVMDTLKSRFRFTDYAVAGPTPHGVETNGEVEDYELVVQHVDYGDAPDPDYPTLLANGGARHVITPSLYLGSTYDSENFANPSVNADGDDNENLDDEDGLIIPVLKKGRTDSIQITISGGSSGIPHIWIDWNQNGSWLEMDERIYPGIIGTGTHMLPVRTPFSAFTGTTYLRCRLCVDYSCDYVGLQYSGEVEDYMITIEDNDLIKWSQPPVYPDEPSYQFWGWDQVSIYGDTVIVADDWLCSELKPVTEIHWWGSYHWWGSNIPTGPGTPTGFHIGIWTDIPAGTGTSWSHPGEMIWEATVPRSSLNETFAGLDLHPDYPGMEDGVFEYTYQIPEENWFYQLPNVGIYWLSIAAVYADEPSLIWGWLSREPSWNDAAVKIYDPTSPVLGNIFISGDPIEDSSESAWDMSFVLLSDSPVISTPLDVTITVLQDSSLAKIEWSEVADARYYIIYSSIDPNASFPSGWTFLGYTENLYWNDGPPLPTGRKKFYKVVAY